MHPLLNQIPRLQLLAIFESAARLGSFTAAAAELGMTQSGVSRQIRATERAIGHPLFERQGNKVSVNADGQQLVAGVQGGFDTIARALSELDDPTFVLAANPGYAQRFLIPHRESLQEVLGASALHLRLFDREAEFRPDAFDAAIHLTRAADVPPGSRRLFDEEVVPVASAEYAARCGLNAKSSIEQLLEVELLHLDGRDRQWMGWSDWFKANDFQWSPNPRRMSANNYTLVMDEALASHGVALAWRGVVDHALDAGMLVEVGPSVTRSERGYFLIPGKGADLSLFDKVAAWLTELTDPG